MNLLIVGKNVYPIDKPSCILMDALSRVLGNYGNEANKRDDVTALVIDSVSYNLNVLNNENTIMLGKITEKIGRSLQKCTELPDKLD